ncbi:SMP-30/gluconolactonase/LRE family protein [Comamonas humi]
MTWHTVISQAFAVGESPFWHSGEQRLYGVDIAGRLLWRTVPGSGLVERWAMPDEPGCIAPARSSGADSGLVVALRDRICRAPVWGGELLPIASLPIDAASQRANDGKCDAQGRLWVGTIHEPASGPRQPVAGLYCVDGQRQSPQGASVRSVLGGVANANGLAWSPDRRTLYWADTPSHTIRRWRCDVQGNPLGEGEVFVQFPGKPEGWRPGEPGYGGRPDGAAVDVDGNYWCAMYEGGRVLQISPAGEILASHVTPALCPTMPCFGGADGRTLYVTSARHGRGQDELAQMPLSGCVFAMRVGVAGLPVQPWREV